MIRDTPALIRTGIIIEAVTIEHGHLARQAFL